MDLFPDLTSFLKLFFLSFLLSSLSLFLPYKKKKNFEGKELPLLGLFLGFFFFMTYLPSSPWLALSLLFVCLAGTLDDSMASPEKGFHGHLSKIKERKITSGFLKAAMIFLISLIYALAQALPLPFLAAIFLSLSSNFLNLLDCSPGRAGKGFYILALLSKVPLPLLACYFPFFWLDVRKKAMLGDGGSNLLGFLVGSYLLRFPPFFWLAFCFLLFLLQLYTEKVSLSSLIEKKRWLKWLDELFVKDATT